MVVWCLTIIAKDSSEVKSPMFRDRRVMNPSASPFKMKWLLAMSVGAGLMIGAAGVFLYDHFVREKRRLLLQSEMMRLDVSVAELRRELEEFRSAHMAQWRKRRRRGERTESNATTASSDVDAMSVIDGDDEDLSNDEFYDLSDGEFDDYTPSFGKTAHALDVDPLLNSFSRDDKLIALERMKRENEKEESPELLWRMAQACHRLAIHGDWTDDNTSVKEAYLTEGLTYATRCIELAPRSADAHKWYAICIGARAETQPIKDKIKDGMAFQRHVLTALQVRPDDATLNHLLGRFNFELASLSWMERKVAATLFGELPSADMTDAISYLLKAEQLHHEPWKENRLILAKAYIHMREYSRAVHWLKKADSAPATSSEDEKAQVEVKSLLEKYKKYG